LQPHLGFGRGEKNAEVITLRFFTLKIKQHKVPLSYIKQVLLINDLPAVKKPPARKEAGALKNLPTAIMRSTLPCR
jgi:hypothetical protein